MLAAEWGIGSWGVRPFSAVLDSSSRHHQALFHPLLSPPHILCSGLRPGTPWGVRRS